MRTHSFHRQSPTGRQDWFYFRCRHGKDRRGNLADSWRQSLIDIIDEPSPRPRQRLQPHQPSPGVHPAIFYSPAHLHRSLQLPAHRRPFGLPKNFAAQLFVKLHAGHTRCFAVGHAGDGRGDGGCGAASGAAGRQVKVIRSKAVGSAWPQGPHLQGLLQASGQLARRRAGACVIVGPHGAHDGGAGVLGQHQAVQIGLGTG